MSDKICVIGAGSCGITAVKALKEAGLPFDCFEMGSNVGGNWRYNNDNGRSSAYASLHIDTSKERMQYSDLPMPAHFPNFPHHSQVLEYFEQYCAHFDLKKHITFHTAVEKVAPAEGGGYWVTTRQVDSQETKQEKYRAVLVCNGHHWQEKRPEFPGRFNGRVLHSHTYREPFEFRGEKVLVVGIGNSGVDIACDVAHMGQKVWLSTRRSAYIVPKYIMGKPTDKWVTPFNSSFPLPLTRFLYKILLHLAVGNQENYGVPRPKHAFLSEHPTMSAELLNLCARGDIGLKPNIKELRENRVLFEDGSEEEITTIIYATGYQISFPFFDPSFIQVEGNELPLYRKVVHPQHEGLYFIGLIQPLGAIMPLAEIQAKWVAGLLSGRYKLPDKNTLQKELAKEQAEIKNRYVHSTRHTIQVDFFPYKRLLEREMGKG